MAVVVEEVLRARAGLPIFIILPEDLLLVLVPSVTMSWRKVAFLTLGSSLTSDACTTTIDSIFAPMLGGIKVILLLRLLSLSLLLEDLVDEEEDFDDDDDDDVVAVLASVLASVLDVLDALDAAAVEEAAEVAASIWPGTAENEVASFLDDDDEALDFLSFLLSLSSSLSLLSFDLDDDSDFWDKKNDKNKKY